MPIADKINFIDGSHVLGDVYMDRKTDIKVRMFDMTGKCSHNDLKTHIQSYGNNISGVIEMEHTSKKKTSKKKTSKKKTSRKYGSIRKKRKTSIKKKKSILMIIGSDDCPYCVSANTKAKKLKGRYNFRYIYNKHTNIRDAIETAKKLTGKNITSIPVYILNEEVVSDPYARL